MSDVPLELRREGFCCLDGTGDALGLPTQSTEIAFHLYPMPELFRLTKERPESNRHLWSDSALAVHNLVDPARRYPNRPCHGILLNPHGLEIFFEQDLSGSDGGSHFVTYDVIGVLLMEVGNSNLCRTQIGPAKNDSPLPVDSDGVKSGNHPTPNTSAMTSA